MRKLICAVVALLTVSAPAQAKPLWNNLTTDMSEAEVNALYPPTKGLERYVRVDLGDSCIADLQFGYRDGKLSSVSMSRSQKAIGKCEGPVVRGLDAKYGEPDSVDFKVKEPKRCGSGAIGGLCKLSGSEDREVRRYSTWKLPSGVEVRLRTTDYNKYEWRVEWVDVPAVPEQIIAKL